MTTAQPSPRPPAAALADRHIASDIVVARRTHARGPALRQGPGYWPFLFTPERPFFSSCPACAVHVSRLRPTSSDSRAPLGSRGHAGLGWRVFEYLPVLCKAFKVGARGGPPPPTGASRQHLDDSSPLCFALPRPSPGGARQSPAPCCGPAARSTREQLTLRKTRSPFVVPSGS